MTIFVSAFFLDVFFVAMYRAFIQTFAIYEGLPNGKFQFLVSAFRIVFLRMSGGLLYFCHLKRKKEF